MHSLKGSKLIMNNQDSDGGARVESSEQEDANNHGQEKVRENIEQLTLYFNHMNVEMKKQL